MGGFQWIRKKLQKIDGFRKRANKFFGGKKQKENRLPEDNTSSFEHATSEKSYRNIMVTQELLKLKEPCENWIEEALEPLKSEYNFEACFGKGEYGSICKLSNKSSKYQVAAKIVLNEDVGAYEEDLWAILKHPHTLPLLQTVHTAKYQVFLSPLMEGGLEAAVYNGKVTFAQLRHYLQGAFEGLNHLHVSGMCHLDVKSDNVLIGGGKGVLCDFGFVAPINSALTNEKVGMPDPFRPPEASLYFGYEAPIPSGEACDLWGCGIMLNELGSNFPLLYAKPEKGNWEKHVYPVLLESLQTETFVARVQLTYNDVDARTALLLHDLILNFLEMEPEKRTSVQNALHHPFFRE
ncbi:hypothetical protein JTE90_002471 [Oedothorax gibbosus]|uniref:Protein kinase domain-containing protein n=1 Tax=Oedothorax gibbosus TaxID=931172 RepID=A0AAV6UJF5_9ARAC|nr:hypothetical protein JTE90_002471 [Oedothorax gibbosus]